MESHLDICLSAIFLFNLSGKGDVLFSLSGLASSVEYIELNQTSIFLRENGL